MKNYFKVFAVVILAVLLMIPASVVQAETGDLQTEEEIWTQLQEALDIIQQNYYSDVDREELLQGALKGMLRALDDPYSQYLSPRDLEQFETSTEGSFTGVGMQVEKSDDFVKVVAPIKGTPAEKAGILTGDIIIAVDSEEIKGYTLEKVVGMIRGEPGTEVVLTVLRHGEEEPVEITITRDLIELEIMEHRMLDEYIGYISLTTFSTRAPEEFAEAMADLKRQGALGLVLDLRSNPGGYLMAGLGITAQFVEMGQPLIYIVDKDGNKQSYSSINHQPEKLPVVVLVNGGSASASEIVAGALQDYGVAELVGETTYGKASVQSLFPLADGGSIKLTTNHYLTPKEREIQDVGLTPDYQVEGEEEQLEKALEVLRERLSTEYEVMELTLTPGSEIAVLNGEKVALTAAPYFEQGMTMAPVRLFEQFFDLSLLWDEELQTVILSGSAEEMTLVTVGEKTINFNGREYGLSKAPEFRQGNVFVPLRDMVGFFGASLNWEAESGTVKIFSMQKK